MASSSFLCLPIVLNSDSFFRSVLPAQGASGLCVVLVVVESQQQFGQIRVDLVVPDAGEDLQQDRRLAAEALQHQRGSVFFITTTVTIIIIIILMICCMTQRGILTLTRSSSWAAPRSSSGATF